MKNGKPNWLLIILAVIGLIVVGPPLLGLALGVVGLFIGLSVALLKVGLVILAIYAMVLLFRRLFGHSPRTAVASGPPSRMTIDAIAYEQERRDRDERAELDRELERALQKKGSSNP